MTSVDSSQDTAYASSYTYDTETYAVKNNINLETESGQKQIRKYYSRIEDFPSNLEYVDSFYDKSTGTSGTAFKDTNTGEIIVAYTGTNPDGDTLTDAKTDIVDIGVGTGGHYDSAYQFYDKMAVSN